MIRQINEAVSSVGMKYFFVPGNIVHGVILWHKDGVVSGVDEGTSYATKRKSESPELTKFIGKKIDTVSDALISKGYVYTCLKGF